MRRVHDWVSCEASLGGLVRTGIFKKLSPELRKALRIYDIIKDKCENDKHTLVTDYGVRPDWKTHYNKWTDQPKENFPIDAYPLDGNRIKVLNELVIRDVVEVEKK